MTIKRLTDEMRLKAVRKTATLKGGATISILHYGADFYNPETLRLLEDAAAGAELHPRF